MKEALWGGIAVAVLIASVPVTVYGLALLYNEVTAGSSSKKACRMPVPILDASVGDGEVTLRWRLPDPPDPTGVPRYAMPQAWQYQRAVQGDSWSAIHDAGQTTGYVVSGLTNGLAYTFQARAQFNADSGCWSTPLTVVPRRIEDVMKEIEKHQRAIAGSIAEVVKGMAARQELFEELGEQGIATLGAVATSTGQIAEHTGAIRDGVVRVATSVDVAGERVAGATAAVAREVAGIREEVDELAESVDAVGQQVAGELEKIAEQLGKGCDGCGVLPANCSPFGKVLFGHNSPEIIQDDNWATIEGKLGALRKQGTGMFLNVGHATAVGKAGHNLRLSDERAACVSRCLDSVLGDGFAFLEVARGEVLDVSDPEGTTVDSDQNRRVDVTFCEDYPIPDTSAQRRQPVWPGVEHCGCADMLADRAI